MLKVTVIFYVPHHNRVLVWQPGETPNCAADVSKLAWVLPCLMFSSNYIHFFKHFDAVRLETVG